MPDGDGRPFRRSVIVGRLFVGAPPRHDGRVAVLVRGGRVERVVDARQVLQGPASPPPEVFDLGSRTLTPAFVDAHTHQPSAARDRFEVRTAHVSSIAELVAALAGAVTQVHAGHWVSTERSLSRAQLAERRFPTREELDIASSEHPIAVRFGAHAMALNSAALRAAGLDAAEDPPGGWLERDRHGLPSGPIHEYGTTRFVEEALDVTSEHELVGALLRTQDDYLLSGITAVRVPGIRPGELSWFQRLAARGELRNRVAACVRVDPNLDRPEKIRYLSSWSARTGSGDDRLRIGPVKLFVDGGVDAADGPEHTYFLERAELTGICLAAARSGWGIACHAVCEEAVERVLDAYEQVRRSTGGGVQLTVEHGFFATPSQLRRAGTLDVWLSTQPGLAALNAHLLPAAGKSGARAFCPLRTSLESHVSTALGSDWNATPGTAARPFSPRRTLAAATDLGPESIDPVSAFRLHTAAAGALFGVPGLGTLVPGAPADVLAYEDVRDERDLADPDGRGPTDVFLAGRPVVSDGVML